MTSFLMVLYTPLDRSPSNIPSLFILSTGHRLQSLTKEGLKFGDEDEDTMKKRLKQYKVDLI